MTSLHKNMKTIDIIGANYQGSYHAERIACRCIVIEENKILLSAITRLSIYMIPGGGLDEGESLEECCKREVEEETGYLVDLSPCALAIIEYYGDEKYTSYYYLGSVKGKGQKHLTEGEKYNGLKATWIDVEEAVSVFSKHQAYAKDFEEIRGIYLREWTALTYMLAQ